MFSSLADGKRHCARSLWALGTVFSNSSLVLCSTSGSFLICICCSVLTEIISRDYVQIFGDLWLPTVLVSRLSAGSLIQGISRLCLSSPFTAAWSSRKLRNHSALWLVSRFSGIIVLHFPLYIVLKTVSYISVSFLLFQARGKAIALSVLKMRVWMFFVFNRSGLDI